MEKEKIIIDNDGGTDDFVAVLYALLSKKFDVKAITLVTGNTTVDNVMKNCFKAFEMANMTPEEEQKIGVYLPEQVNTNVVSDGAHGDNGLGGIRFQLKNKHEVSKKTAEEILIETINNNPKEISVIAIGPLTNIANVIKKDKNFVNNVKELVIMGGDEGGGNITPYAEFNVYEDPEAAKVVFEAGFKKITMIGFNITKQFTISPEIETFLNQNEELGKFIYDITRITAELDRRKNKLDGASTNDVLTLFYLINKAVFLEKEANVIVDTSNTETRGRTTIQELRNLDSKCNVVTSADYEKIMGELLNTLFPNKSKEVEETLLKRKERINRTSQT